MQVSLIRHGKTNSNLEHRYQGRLDDPLCEQGIVLLQQNKAAGIYPAAERVICSPKQRCIQTARIICGEEMPIFLEPELRETDFGKFEGKTYEELKEDADYLRWLDSNGTGEIPGGESQAQMSERCVKGFCQQMEYLSQTAYEQVLFVVHGGTIMALLERFADPAQPFSSFYVENGDGYCIQIDDWDAQKRYPIFPIQWKE